MSCFLTASLHPSEYSRNWPVKVFCSMGQSSHVDYFPKNLSLTLNIKKDISTKNLLKAAIDCILLTAINWWDIMSCYFGQHLLFICLKMFVISVTSKTEYTCMYLGCSKNKNLLFNFM